jgi:hypothetical protein
MQKDRNSLRNGFLATLVAVLLSAGTAIADPIMPLESPGQFSEGSTTIDFDGFPDLTIVNDLYLQQGVRFTRDDGQVIFISDWAALGRATTSPPNVVATIGLDPVPFVDHLNLVFTTPAFEVGAFFGNDQDPSFHSITLSVYDAVDNLIGSVTVPTNANTHVDQFVGLRSEVPFVRARFQNNQPSLTYAVVLDDVIFTPVDECSNSDLSATVIIDGCNTGVPNTLFPRGCTISDLIAACAEGASNHGHFVSCISHLTNDLKKAGTITGPQKGAIQSCAAQANIP